jgi:kynurenine formamidase
MYQPAAGRAGSIVTRLVDISVSLPAGIAPDPPGHLPASTTTPVRRPPTTSSRPSFPGGRSDLPGGERWAIERVQATTRDGTHLDGLYHFSSTMDGGARSITIDEVPLEWCFQPAVKPDFRHLPDGYIATSGDVRDELKRIGHQLAPLEIVWLTPRRVRAAAPRTTCPRAAASAGARRCTCSNGVYGSPALTPGSGTRPSCTAARYAADGDPSVIWKGHRVGRDIGYWHLEKLDNLETLPDDGFTVSCFLVKIHAALAGWTRAVAIVDGQ